MSQALRSLGIALALLPVLMVAAALPVWADGGPACGALPGRPTCTILRPLPPPLRQPPPTAPECIVAVGGLGSRNDDPAFRELLAPFGGDPRYEIHRFGGPAEDPSTFPYDTYGAVSVNGLHLRRFVRSLSDRCQAIHVVTHSMGGAVADRAFSMGLSTADGVVTYLPLSGPHNGAMVARYLRGLVERDEHFAEATSVISQALHVHDPTTPAVRDLALIRPPRPVRDVIELRQRLADDAFVYLPDNWDRRFEVRDRLPDAQLIELDGHGGSLQNAEIRATTAHVIRRLEIPPDDRPLLDKALALVMSVALMFIALYAGGRLEGPIVKGIMLSKAVTVALGIALPLLEGAITAAIRAAAAGVELARAILSVFADGLNAAADLAGRANDARVSLVRRVLADAARTLGP